MQVNEDNRTIRYEPPPFPDSPLAEVATRSRRNLVAVMAGWLLIVPMGLTPTKIQWLGIELDRPNLSIAAILSVCVLYFWLTFVIYAYRDWASWQYKCASSLDQASNGITELESEITQVHRATKDARKESRSDDFQLELMLPRNHGSSNTNKLSEWEYWVLQWEADLPRIRKNRSQMRLYILARTTWDYWLPAAFVVGPIWYWLQTLPWPAGS